MTQLSCPATSEQWQAYFELRWRELRAPWDQPLGSERDEFDEADSGVHHLAAFDSANQLIGVGRVHLVDHATAQIRYMAVAADSRGQGIGRAIVQQLEEFAADEGVLQIILNARDKVVGFYQKLGYKVVATGPTMFGSVKHSRMTKRL